MLPLSFLGASYTVCLSLGKLASFDPPSHYSTLSLGLTMVGEIIRDLYDKILVSSSSLCARYLHLSLLCSVAALVVLKDCQ